MYIFLTKSRKPGTEIVSLGAMLHEGPGESWQGLPMDLFYYVDNDSGPSVVACCTFRGKEEVCEFSLRDESDNIDPHVTEAFRRARKKGLID